MKNRLICFLLAMAFVAFLIPAPVSAAPARVEEIEKQISSTYRAAQRGSGKTSFNGYCGKLVNWQTYLLGIDNTVYGCNGKDEFDLYRNLGTTTGGYQVKCYPSSQYDLQTALNEITNNGTVDAYNILVGFQRTNTKEGSIYGHAMLVHAILDGTVYFVECYSTSLDGKYWAEGTPISCSIDTFCKYYNAWTEFDGIAYFGLKTYADACEFYPTSMYAMAQENAQIYEEPFDFDANNTTSTVGQVISGQMVEVTGLLKTPGGAYWYRLEGENAYVPEQALTFATSNYEDVQITNLKVPGALRKGYGFVLRGEVLTNNSSLDCVEVVVYDPQEGIDAPVFSGSLEGLTQSVNLNSWKLDQAMRFRTLDAGTYRIVITAQLGIYVLENGVPVYRSETKELWHSELEVTAGWGKYVTVHFDGNGGMAEIAQTVLPQGDVLEALPQATMIHGAFKEWTLDPEGTQPVTSDTIIAQDTVLYAQWEADRTAPDGWQSLGDKWVFYEGGKIMQGWIALGDIIIYQYEDGTRACGQKQIDGEWYQFSEDGVLIGNWQNVYDRIDLLNANLTRPVQTPSVQAPALPALPVEPESMEEAQAGMPVVAVVVMAFGTVFVAGGTGTAMLILRKKASAQAAL